MELLAHSAPKSGERGPQPYSSHVQACEQGSVLRAEEMLRYATGAPPALLAGVRCAAHWHDLGKVDDVNQAALRRGRGAALKVDHMDAGIAQADSLRNPLAAWLVRAHHAPGLPAAAAERQKLLPLRGHRDREADPVAHRLLTDHTNRHLSEYVSRHKQALQYTDQSTAEMVHGLDLRLALSCLVDADHTDSACWDTGTQPPKPLEPRWDERLAALDQYVAGLPRKGNPARTSRRERFYASCRDSPIADRVVACEGPVGIGKTTAVLAYLLRQATEEGLRHIFIVAPYTNIITQTVARVRQAVVLPGERPEEVVAEHHHRADFAAPELRAFATLWQAPIVVTTAVQFFETLATNRPAQLRKLHELPGSAVFIDEAHAAVPVQLWAQNWRWISELAERWGCRFVLASGSLTRVWESSRIVDQPRLLAVIGEEVSEEANRAEPRRVRHEWIPDALSRDELCVRVEAADGPRLVILNTVQSAAVIAWDLRRRGKIPCVMHLSTALCPRDRDRILQSVERQLNAERELREKGAKLSDVHPLRNWVLVATSCVEAGVDLSFASAFRENCSIASTLQVGGRVNRDAERTPGAVHVFALQPDPWLTEHPAFKTSKKIQQLFFERGVLGPALDSPAEVVTRALEHELRIDLRGRPNALTTAEDQKDYPAVAVAGRVIDSDTRLVVVDERLRRLIESGRKPSYRLLLRRSVHLWPQKIQGLGLQPLGRSEELWAWGGLYDANFLGCMADVVARLEAGEPAGCYLA